MSRLIVTQEQIPDAPFYVLMRDVFFSNWGLADARDAYYIAPCSSRDEAEIVANNAHWRSDQDRIEILTKKPMVHREARFGLMTKMNASRWFIPNGFK